MSHHHWHGGRKENPDIHPDLGEVGLREANLDEANLFSANLRRANLSEASLSRADLVRANLEGAKFDGANLRGASLSEANLDRAALVGADLRGANLSGANLSGADLRRANLSRANLVGANLEEAKFGGVNLFRANLDEDNERRRFIRHLGEANLSRADLRRANLSETNLSGANLRRANLSEANLDRADLDRANLRGANLSGADLVGADLREANLRRANLTEVSLIRTDLTGADLTGCRIYGISAWALKLEGTKQHNLVITPENEPEITVDNIEVAQFIYLLLHNKKIREVIDTIGKKAVLILGRFTADRRAVLDALREELRKRDYVPILFDFDKPASQDLTATVSTLAHLARFIIADLTDPSSIPYELATVVPTTPVPVQPILLSGTSEFAMFQDLRRRHHWVLATHRYASQEQLIAELGKKVISPAELKVLDLQSST
jgi:uncharacterized protein YjbI with pentapeptide repeats